MFAKRLSVDVLKVVLALVLMASLVTPVSAAVSHSITFDHLEYYQVGGIWYSKWHYKVTSSGDPAISHVTIRLCVSCDDVTAGSSEFGAWECGPDDKTGLTGIKWQLPGEEGVYYVWFELEGTQGVDWWQGWTDYGIKYGDEVPLYGPVWGPVCSPPESVVLAGSSVTPGRGGILIAWETASEINNLGFNLYRSTGDNPQTAIKINSQLIPSRWAGVAGASYSYLDRTARPAVSYHYWLEDVEAGDGVMQIGLHDLGRGQWNRPLVIALWPKNSGQVYSTPQRFTATFRDADGDLSKVSLLIGDSPTAAAKVVARYDRSTRQFSLVGGTYAALHRAACGVRVEEGGQKLTVTWTLSFKEGFRGVHNLYLRAQDAPGNITPWRLMGTWNVR